jgi:predicted small lipoprotein YifL
MPAPLPENHFCAQCGSRGPFELPSSLKCEKCHAAGDTERSKYQRTYQKAKSAALRKLMENHREEFDTLFFHERVEAERSGTTFSSGSPGPSSS